MSYIKDEIRRILREADYMGLIGSGAPTDEYDEEVDEIYQRLNKLEGFYKECFAGSIFNKVVAHVFSEFFSQRKPDYQGVKKISDQISELYEVKIEVIKLPPELQGKMNELADAADEFLKRMNADKRFSQRIKK